MSSCPLVHSRTLCILYKTGTYSYLLKRLIQFDGMPLVCDCCEQALSQLPRQDDNMRHIIDSYYCWKPPAKRYVGYSETQLCPYVYGLMFVCGLAFRAVVPDEQKIWADSKGDLLNDEMDHFVRLLYHFDRTCAHTMELKNPLLT